MSCRRQGLTNYGKETQLRTNEGREDNKTRDLQEAGNEGRKSKPRLQNK